MTDLKQLAEAVPEFAAHAQEVDRTGVWPAADLAELERLGAFRWVDEIDALTLHQRYQKIAAGSLALALIISQRDSAVGMVQASPNDRLREQFLPALLANEFFTTIGIAQLTTSRQGGVPALRAQRVAGGFRIDGTIPWATGAGKSRYVMAGAILPDNQQVLFALPTDAKGVSVNPPLELVALRATWTTSIDCAGVTIDDAIVLREPGANALAGRGKGVPAMQAFLGMGLVEGALRLIQARKGEPAAEAHRRLHAELERVRKAVDRICAPGRDSAEVAAEVVRIRGTINDLAIRTTSTAVALGKGSSLLPDQAEQRLAREALFLLVWSCPSPVVECTLNFFAGAQRGMGMAEVGA